MSQARRVLIVEDDEATRDVVTAVLKGDGYEVVTLANGTDAVATILKQHPDLVVLDIMLPGMDGIQIIGQLTGLGQHVPILVITALPERTLATEGLAVLRKPFSLDAFLGCIRALLRGAQPQAELC